MGIIGGYRHFLTVNVKSEPSLFGVSVPEMDLREDSVFPGFSFKVPSLLSSLRHYLVDRRGLEEEGIFRKAGDEAETANVKNKLNKGVFKETPDIHAISNLLKVSRLPLILTRVLVWLKWTCLFVCVDLVQGVALPHFERSAPCCDFALGRRGKVPRGVWKVHQGAQQICNFFLLSFFFPSCSHIVLFSRWLCGFLTWCVKLPCWRKPTRWMPGAYVTTPPLFFPPHPSPITSLFLLLQKIAIVIGPNLFHSAESAQLSALESLRLSQQIVNFVLHILNHRLRMHKERLGVTK